MSDRSATFFAIIGILACIPLGCGEKSGRVEVSRTTEAEKESGQMYTADLAAASDKIAQAFSADINRMAEEDWSDYRVTMIFGDISNKSYAMPVSDFEYVRHRIKNKLHRSRLFRDNVKLVEGRARVDRMNKEELGGDEDLLDENWDDSDDQGPVKEYTFYLFGDVIGVHRGPTKLYYLQFSLVRASDREEVFSEDYEIKYDFDD